jgi:pimeloyl-ACP methyl ester carboxylesterase
MSVSTDNGHGSERSKQIEIDGSLMNVLDVGAGAPVLLGHSYLWNAQMWRPQIDALARRYRVIVPELWGHGASGALPSGTSTLRDLARQHLILLDRLGVEKTALVGLSVGAMWGAELAIMTPQRISSLVLMDTSLAPEPEEQRQQYLAMFKTVEALGSMPDPLRQIIVPLYFARDVASRRPDLPPLFDEALGSWNSQRLVDSVAPLGRIIFNRRDALDDVARLRLPSLVMTGAGDIPQPPSRGQEIADRMGCPFIEVPNAGHIANLEAAEFVTGVIEAFLVENPAR